MTQAPPDSTLLDAALALHDAGLCVVPAAADGSKRPAIPWKRWQTELPSREQVIEWFSDDRYDGLGIVTGNVSGNAEMLEMEGSALHEGIANEFREIAENSGLGELWARVTRGYLEFTPRGGLHTLYIVAGAALPNIKLACRPATAEELQAAPGDRVKVLIETRGEGGFTILAPSGGRTHPNGKPWIKVSGGPAEIAVITPDEREALHTLARVFDRMPAAVTGAPLPLPRSVPDPSAGLKPGDDFNARASWQDILAPHGWTAVFTRGQVTYWRRPGKNAGISATSGRNDGDNLYVFTTSTVFEADAWISKFGAYALLEHGGDYSAAAAELRRRGYGSVDLPAIVGLQAQTGSQADAGPSSADSGPGDDDGGGRAATSWAPRDLAGVLDGSHREPEPEFLARDDGLALFYSGKVNGLIGESESGKTWAALLAVAQTLDAGGSVLYLDFEDTAGGIVARMRAIGVEDFTRFAYIGPDEGLHPAARDDLAGALAAGPDLIVLDGFNAAMTLLGLDLNSNTDATKFSQTLLKVLVASGAALIYIDHLPKSRDAQGKGGIGAQAKRAMTTGCALRVEVSVPFGRGMSGKLKLLVDKDRPGMVRGISSGATLAGTLHIRSHGEFVELEIAAPDMRAKSERPPFRPTFLMQKVCEFLATIPEGANARAIEAHIGSRRDHVRAAVSALVAEGYIVREPGPRGALIHRLKRMYLEAYDPAKEAP